MLTLKILLLLAFQEAEALSPIPSMNAWELSQQLLMQPDYQQAIRATPQQLNALRALRAEKRFETILMAEIRPMLRESPHLSIHQLITPAWAKLDRLVLKEFSAIFSTEQLAALRSWPMKQRFQTGVSPFLDAEILSHFGLKSNEIPNVLNLAQAEAAEYEAKLAAMRERGAKKVIAKMDEESRVLFAHYVGSELVGIASDSETVSPDDIPFPEQARSVGSLGTLFGTPSCQEKLGIDQPELRRLKKLYLDHTKRISKFRSEHRADENAKHEFIQESLRETYHEMCDILSERQRLLYAQHISALLFFGEYMRPFRAAKNRAYFHISDQERSGILDECISQERIAKTEQAALNRRAFRNLLDELPTESQSKLKAAFEGFWAPVLAKE